MTVCITCNVNTTKYKCPLCKAYYCSLPCYTTHKEVPCKATDDETKNVEVPEPRKPMPFKTEDTVDITKLEALEHSEGLRNLLYNPHLRNFLKEVDSAPDAWKAIRSAMQEPLFLEFADECLKIVEPTSGYDDPV
ncbi:unnamed protein product [Hermetia illucens]|uniref:Zinc finger HIT domain-containing protein 3 n=1 Tax=Hermetia illucens TaxID=343691 RepID=A0A7R8YYJ0_HERIL|nr:zinc finger HIT domain-containing protein 3 [Hermetia illucens]CAD7089027.1 unnamed protein product [Hermetia illucens]